MREIVILRLEKIKIINNKSTATGVGKMQENDIFVYNDKECQAKQKKVEQNR